LGTDSPDKEVFQISLPLNHSLPKIDPRSIFAPQAQWQ
jgi:hypothetical protein